MINAFLAAKTATVMQKEQLSKTRGYYLAFVALGLTVASLGPTLPGLAENTKTDLSEVGFLFTVRSTGYLLGSILSGRLYDRMSGNPIMATALAVVGMMLFLAPLIPILWLLVAVFLVLGMAEGSIDVGGNTLMVWVHGRDVGPFMNALHFFFGVGGFLAPIIIAQAVLLSNDITFAYWVLAAAMIIIALWVIRLPSPVSRTASSDEPTQELNYALFSLIALFFFLYVAGEGSFAGWIFTYAQERDLANEQTAAYMTSLFWATFTLGRLLSVPLGARFRPRTILLVDILGGLASAALMVFWTSPIALWIGICGIGLSMASVFPTLVSFAENNMNITGKVTSGFFVAASLAGMTIPWGIGYFFESIGPQVLMWVIFADMLLTLGLYALLMAYITTRQDKAVGQNA